MKNQNNNINSQLLEVTTILNRNSINYRLDSGSLLGIIREGKLLSHDNDIDISLLNTNPEQIRLIASEFKLLGYSPLFFYYNKDLFKVKLLKNKSRFSVDLNIFIKRNNNYINAQRIVIDKKDHKHNLIKYNLFRLLKYVVLFWLENVPCKDICRPPYSWVYRMYSWIIPQSYFDGYGEVIVDNCSIKVPNNAFKYLTFRYGNWKVPDKQWTLLKDGGLSSKSPDKL